MMTKRKMLIEKYRVVGSLLAALSLLGFTASSQGAESEPGDAEEGSRVIGASMVTEVRGFHTELTDGMRSAAEELGVELLVTSAEGDPSKQLDDVNTLLQRGIDGLLIVPVDAEAAVPVYELLSEKNIPIISVARDANTDLKTSFVGAEWEEYGRMIAEWHCEATGGDARVAMIKGPAGASFVQEMEAGYKKFVDARCPGLDIAFEAHAEQDGAAPGLALAQNALTAVPDVDAIYVNADDTAMGVLQALREAGRLEDVIVTGFNGEPDAFEAIRAGELDMTIALHPYRWGQLALKSMAAYLAGETLPDLVPIETTVVHQANIGDLSDEELR